VSQTIRAFVTGKWKENCYAVSDGRGNAVVIDPGDDFETIVDYLIESGLKLLAILNTHGHYDHVGAVAALRWASGAPFYLHSGDLRLLRHTNLYRKLFDGERPIVIPQVDRFCDENQGQLTFGGMEFRVLHTPGHTAGGVSFVSGTDVFTGDTLFRGAVGRIDLPGGDERALRTSLRKLSLLDPEMAIHPGHGRPSTIGAELQDNAAFRKALECA
jgi:glyoxylase-like metal-dependent hydrolase (beta-lactamase superfamily II)